MAHRIVMPALEMAQETGKVLAWRKKQGEGVAQGEPLLDIETDKAVVEMESPAGGILAGVKARVGDVVPVGQTIAWILLPGESLPAEAPQAPEIKVSPKARRLAREHGIDLARVRGSGSEGEILAEDVLALAAHPEKPKPIPAATSSQSLNSIARLTAERTAESWTSVPHFFVVRDIDATAMIQARVAFLRNDPGPRVTYTDFLILLAARTLLKHPRMNASWTPGEIRFHPAVNIGIAIAVEGGVSNIAIPGAESITLSQIAALRLEMTERARAGRSRPADIAGATFTISNLGMYNVDAFTAIIPPGQAAILAVGRIADRTVVVDGQPVVRAMMTVTLSCDHRVIDGVGAAKFLSDFADPARQAAELGR